MLKEGLRGLGPLDLVVKKTDQWLRRRHLNRLYRALESYGLSRDRALSPNSLEQFLLNQKSTVLARLHSSVLLSENSSCGSISYVEDLANEQMIFRNILDDNQEIVQRGDKYYRFGFQPYGVPHKLVGREHSALILGLTDLNRLLHFLPRAVDKSQNQVVMARTNPVMARALVEQLDFGISEVFSTSSSPYGVLDWPLIDREKALAAYNAGLGATCANPAKSYYKFGANIEVYTTTANLLKTQTQDKVQFLLNKLVIRRAPSSNFDSQEMVLRQVRTDAIMYICGLKS